MKNRDDIVTVYVNGKPVKRKAYITYKGFLGMLGLKHFSVESVPEFIRQNYLRMHGKVKKQPPDLTAGEFNRREC